MKDYLPVTQSGIMESERMRDISRAVRRARDGCSVAEIRDSCNRSVRMKYLFLAFSLDNAAESVDVDMKNYSLSQVC